MAFPGPADEEAAHQMMFPRPAIEGTAQEMDLFRAGGQGGGPGKDGVPQADV